MNNDNETAAEVKALRQTVSDLAAKVERLEALAVESHSVIVSQQQAAKGEGMGSVREAEVGYQVATEREEDREPAYAPDDSGEDWSVLAGQDIVGVVARGRKGEKLLAELIRVYSAFPEVRAIAVGPYLDEIRVFVMVEMREKYDDELMGKLLDAEFDLLDRFHSLTLSMSYAPIGDLALAGSRYNCGTIVWRRDLANNE